MNEKKVIVQYEAIRRLGQTNMWDKYMVQMIAHKNHFHELVVAIEEDYSYILKNYSKLMEGVKEEDIPEAKYVETVWQLRE